MKPDDRCPGCGSSERDVETEYSMQGVPIYCEHPWHEESEQPTNERATNAD